MRIDPLIQWMKQVHGKVSSAMYAPLLGQTNSQHIAFLRSLEKEMEAEKGLHTPLQDLNVVVFDFETTGFSPEQGDQILSIGAVKSKGWTVSNNEFYSAVHFDGDLPQKVKALTGLEESQLREAPALSDVLFEFYQFVQGDTLVAHHANHEKKFLQQANWKFYKSSVKHRIVDTSLIFNVAVPEENITSLEDYCAHSGISIRDRHHALGDAKMTAQLWSIYLKKLHEEGCDTLSDVYDRVAKYLQMQKDVDIV